MCKLHNSLLCLAMLIAATFPLSLTGQNAASFARYDSLSYDDYQHRDWKQLIANAEQALSEGYDSYYLRMRLGIAFLETFKPALAEKHFRKALAMTTDDRNAKYFLFKALSYQLKTVESGHLFQTMDANTQWATGLNSGFKPVAAHLDAGYSTGNSIENRSFEALSGEHGLYGQEYAERDNLIYDAGFHFQPSPAWLFYVGGQHIGIETNDRFATREFALQRDSIISIGSAKAYYFHPEAVESIRDFAHDLQQNSVYVQAQWAGSDRWSLVAAMHLLKVRRGFTVSTPGTTNLTDTSYYNASDGRLEHYTFEVPTVNFNDISWNTTDYSLSLHGRFHFGRLSALVGLGRASFNDTSLLQLNAGYQFLPLCNLQLVHQGEIFILSYGRKPHFAYRASLAWKATRRLSLESDLLAGAINNLSEQYGYIVYNNPENIRFKVEVSAAWLISPHLQLQLRYRLRQAEQPFRYAIPENTNLQSDSYLIESNTFIGGIKWIF